MDSARHVLGCQSIQETRVRDSCDDVASTIHQPLPGGHLRRAPVLVLAAVRANVQGLSLATSQLTPEPFPPLKYTGTTQRVLKEMITLN